MCFCNVLLHALEVFWPRDWYNQLVDVVCNTPLLLQIYLDLQTVCGLDCRFAPTVHGCLEDVDFSPTDRAFAFPQQDFREVPRLSANSGTATGQPGPPNKLHHPAGLAARPLVEGLSRKQQILHSRASSCETGEFFRGCQSVSYAGSTPRPSS